MNQRPPTQRPPVHTPRPAPSGQMRRPMPSRPTEPTPKYGKAFFALLITTVSLLLVSLIVLGVVLCVGGFNSPTPSGSDDGASTPPQKQQQNTPVNSVSRIPSSLTLPSATPAGNYLSSGMGTDMSSDSSIASDYAILVSLTNNSALATKQADTVIHPASMTKVMTLLVACEKAQAANDLLTVKQEMLDRRKALEGSGELTESTTVVAANGDIKQISAVGQSVTVEDALYLINYQSDTVACLLIAEYIAGSEAAFVELMNQKAKDLHLDNTNFVNCTGLTELDGSHNVTTCREMAAIMACALKNQVAKQIITSSVKHETKIYANGSDTGNTIPFFADWHNKRLGGQTTVGKIQISGGKTGYEYIPTSCFVTYAKNTQSGEEYVCVTVGRKASTQAEIDSTSTAVNNSQSAADTKHIYRTYAS